MFGKYNADALKGMSAKRTGKAKEVIKGLGGKITAMYALIGNHDLVLIVDLPGVEEVMKASVSLTKLTGIGFTTSPAVSVEDFDKLMADA